MIQERSSGHSIDSASRPYLVKGSSALAVSRVSISSQLFYVVEGELTFDTGKESFTLTKGQAVLFDPGDPHYTINKGDELSQCLVITVDQK
jgi:mannose-6-phosphate isomerase-like protein (cupin superfamily)